MPVVREPQTNRACGSRGRIFTVAEHRLRASMREWREQRDETDKCASAREGSMHGSGERGAGEASRTSREPVDAVITRNPKSTESRATERCGIARIASREADAEF